VPQISDAIQPRLSCSLNNKKHHLHLPSPSPYSRNADTHTQEEQKKKVREDKRENNGMHKEINTRKEGKASQRSGTHTDTHAITTTLIAFFLTFSWQTAGKNEGVVKPFVRDQHAVKEQRKNSCVARRF
jgi:hypothetical protein